MAKKDVLKDIGAYDAICSILLLKPKCTKESENRFDAQRLYVALRESSKKHKRLDDYFGTGRNVQLLKGMSREFCRYISILGMRTIGQFQDELHTEVYYINPSMKGAIVRDLEERLGRDFFERFEPVAKDIWNNYESLAFKKKLTGAAEI